MFTYRTNALTVTQTAEINNMPHDHERTYIYFEFAIDSEFKSIVVPATGSVTVTASENGVYYGSVVGGNALAINTQDYDRLTIGGIVVSVKAVPSEITGARYWRMIVARYK